MRTFWTLLVCLFLCLSCTSNSIYAKPDDLIPKDSMKMILKDLYLATAAKNIKNIRQQRRFSYIPLVYQKYKIDSTRFKESSLYYTSKIDVYEPMLNEILVVLEKERAMYAKQRSKRDSIRQDSIKKVRQKINDKPKDSFGQQQIKGTALEYEYGTFVDYYLYNPKGFYKGGVLGPIGDMSLSKGVKMAIDSITFCPSGLQDLNKRMTLGFLHKAIKSLNQLRMIEDSLVIYRLSRAPERRIF